jgi:hypothetical protein
VPALVVAALVVFAWSAQVEGRRRELAIGGVLAIALCVGVLALPSAADADGRFAAVTRIWEPIPGETAPPSHPL